MIYPHTNNLLGISTWTPRRAPDAQCAANRSPRISPGNLLFSFFGRMAPSQPKPWHYSKQPLLTPTPNQSPHLATWTWTSRLPYTHHPLFLPQPCVFFVENHIRLPHWLCMWGLTMPLPFSCLFLGNIPTPQQVREAPKVSDSC